MGVLKRGRPISQPTYNQQTITGCTVTQRKKDEKKRETPIQIYQNNCSKTYVIIKIKTTI